MTENKISNTIIGIAIEVHKVPGPEYLKLPAKNACIIKSAKLVCG